MSLLERSQRADQSLEHYRHQNAGFYLSRLLCVMFLTSAVDEIK